MLARQFFKSSVILFALALLVKLIFFSTHQYFSQDVVRDYLFVSEHLTNHNFYLPLGPAAASYSNFSVPPLYYYLQLFAQGIGQNYFYSMTILIILLESLTPVLIFYWVRKIVNQVDNFKFKKLLPFLIAILYIFSPLVITASTSSWNPNLVPFFTVLFLFSGQLFLFDKRHKYLPVAILAFVFLVNLHFQWFVLLPFLILLIVIALYRWRSTWKYLLLSVLASLLLLSPYLHFEITHQFSNLKAALTFITGSSDTIAVERISKPKYLLFFFPTFYQKVFAGNTYKAPDCDYVCEFQATPRTIVFSVIFFSIMFAVIYKIFQKYRAQKSFQAIAWLISPLILFAAMALTLRLYKGDKPDYFLYIFLPFIFIFLAMALTNFKKKIILIFIFVILLISEIYALFLIKPVNQFHDYQSAIALINTFPMSERALIPLSQNLITPLSFFYNPQIFSSEISPQKKYNLLICEPWQNCLGYQPGVLHQNNFFKYDLVTPRDYSASISAYRSELTQDFSNETLQIKVIVQEN